MKKIPNIHQFPLWESCKDYLLVGGVCVTAISHYHHLSHSGHSSTTGARLVTAENYYQSNEPGEKEIGVEKLYDTVKVYGNINPWASQL